MSHLVPADRKGAGQRDKAGHPKGWVSRVVPVTVRPARFDLQQRRSVDTGEKGILFPVSSLGERGRAMNCANRHRPHPFEGHKLERGEEGGKRQAALLFEYTVQGVASDILPNDPISLTVEADDGERIGLVIHPRDCGYNAEEHFVAVCGPLLDLVNACGIDILEDTEQFHGKPFRLFVRRFREKDGLRIASAWLSGFKVFSALTVKIQTLSPARIAML